MHISETKTVRRIQMMDIWWRNASSASSCMGNACRSCMGHKPQGAGRASLSCDSGHLNTGHAAISHVIHHFHLMRTSRLLDIVTIMTRERARLTTPFPELDVSKVSPSDWSKGSVNQESVDETIRLPIAIWCMQIRERLVTSSEWGWESSETVSSSSCQAVRWAQRWMRWALRLQSFPRETRRWENGGGKRGCRSMAL